MQCRDSKVLVRYRQARGNIIPVLTRSVRGAPGVVGPGYAGAAPVKLLLALAGHAVVERGVSVQSGVSRNLRGGESCERGREVPGLLRSSSLTAVLTLLPASCLSDRGICLLKRRRFSIKRHQIRFRKDLLSVDFAKLLAVAQTALCVPLPIPSLLP